MSSSGDKVTGRISLSNVEIKNCGTPNSENFACVNIQFVTATANTTNSVVNSTIHHGG
jgi:hypothetical protein